MPLNLGDTFPNFKANTTVGQIKWHDWQGDSWAILFSHPKDFTPVCTTELGKIISLAPEFEKRGVKVAALSCDDIPDHERWSKDIKAYSGVDGDLPFPIIDDKSRALAKLFGMVDADEKDPDGMPLTCRAVFIVGPDKKLKLSILYPATTGRNFDEILRVIDSLQLTAVKKCATPANWKPGDRVMVVPSLSKEAADEMFPGYETIKLPSGKEYLRFATLK